MRLSSLLSALPYLSRRPGEADPEITLVTDDSRRVMPGALFVAVRGGTTDGHRFIPDALARGAAAVVAEEAYRPSQPHSAPLVVVADSRLALGWLAAAFHGYPARQMVLIGVTGTDGKTTTATLIHAALAAAGLRAGLISTVGAVVGDETVDTGFHVTTPGAPELQAYLARMVAAGCTHVVLEVTSHGLAQQRLAGCDFDVAVVTNITHEHLDYHKTFESYRAAKASLLTGLAASAAKRFGPAKAGVLNLDDRSYDYLRPLAGERHFSYGLASAADVRAEDVRHAPGGAEFRAVGPGWEVPVSTALVGLHNISNCLAAVATTVLAIGLPLERACRGIAAVRGVPGRMERIDLGQRFTAIVDFAHTPNALRRALETARAITAGRVIAVFGSAGLRDVEKRTLMAEASAERADVTVLTAEDPRTESLDDILEVMAAGAAARGGVEGETLFRVPDRGEALRLAVRLARPGDLVIACGKGHEQSMCFGTVEYPWDDRVALRAALAEALGVPGPAMPRLPTSAQSL